LCLLLSYSPRLCLMSSFTSSSQHPPATAIYTLSLHDALPIWASLMSSTRSCRSAISRQAAVSVPVAAPTAPTHSITSTAAGLLRSEEHTSELQSHLNLVCRLLLEKKKR